MCTRSLIQMTRCTQWTMGDHPCIKWQLYIAVNKCHRPCPCLEACCACGADSQCFYRLIGIGLVMRSISCRPRPCRISYLSCRLGRCSWFIFHFSPCKMNIWPPGWQRRMLGTDAIAAFATTACTWCTILIGRAQPAPCPNVERSRRLNVQAATPCSSTCKAICPIHSLLEAYFGEGLPALFSIYENSLSQHREKNSVYLYQRRL